MKKIVKAIDIDFPADTPIESDGVAYYRLDKNFKEFLTKCNNAGGGIIGFEFEDGSFNFGVVIGKIDGQRKLTNYEKEMMH